MFCENGQVILLEDKNKAQNTQIEKKTEFNFLEEIQNQKNLQSQEVFELELIEKKVKQLINKN